MDGEDIIILAMLVFLVIVPALGVTARFALKPIVDALLRLKEGGLLPTALRNADDAASLTAEVRQLRVEIAQLQQSVARLEEAESFHRGLAGHSGTPRLPDGVSGSA